MTGFVGDDGSFTRRRVAHAPWWVEFLVSPRSPLAADNLCITARTREAGTKAVPTTAVPSRHSNDDYEAKDHGWYQCVSITLGDT